MYFHVVVLPNNHSTRAGKDIPPIIQALLNKFHSLFQTPHNLPPERDTNHHIHLLPHATPVIVRPYRYPYYQKQEIET